MVSHTSPDSLRMPPPAVGDRLPWGDCPALSYALVQYPCQRRLDEGRSCSARVGARAAVSYGAWPGQDHARRKGDVLWGGLEALFDMDSYRGTGRIYLP